MKAKKIVLAISLVILLACGIYTSVCITQGPPTYDGTAVDVIDLYENNSDYDNSGADGVAAIMVNENLEKTAADNVVFSVVFNYRGYDTLGESFILIAAIAGTGVILRKTKKKNDGKEKC